MPVCWAQATPATMTSPDFTDPPPSRGTSMREESFTGPRSDQPRSVQYATCFAKVVTSSCVTHLVADT